MNKTSAGVPSVRGRQPPRHLAALLFFLGLPSHGGNTRRSIAGQSAATPCMHSLLDNAVQPSVVG